MFCRIGFEPIEPSALIGRVRGDADGAVVLFVGVVRDHNAGRPVERLQYEAYQAMAERKLSTICEQVRLECEVSDVAVEHRLGELVIGEVSVAIAVAAPHRDAAYRASREIIERLKREVPIWKRECYADGAEEWQTGTEPRVP